MAVTQNTSINLVVDQGADFSKNLTVTTDGSTGYLYEVSYAYPVNDALTITPGIAIVDTDAGETTTAAVKASFSF